MQKKTNDKLTVLTTKTSTYPIMFKLITRSIDRFPFKTLDS